jgi:rod shape determining protein RodA
VRNPAAGEVELTTLTSMRVSRRGATTASLRTFLTGMDWILIVVAGMLLVLGVVMIKTSTSHAIAGNPGYFETRQIIFLLPALIACIGFAMFDIRRLQPYPRVLLGGLLGALLVVFAIGVTVRGANAWISVGPFQLQPSELGKIALVVILASLAVERIEDIDRWRTTLMLTAVAAGPALLIFLEPDLGMALIYMAILGGVLFVAGTPWKHFAASGIIIATSVVMAFGVLPSAGIHVVKGYQLQRMTAFLNGGSGNTAGYQLAQSKTAIGSGGALGKGVGGATQTVYNFLPEDHTDFIFAVVGEVFGFVGAATVVVLFGILMWRALRITAQAATQFEQIVAAGICAMFGFEVVVNIGMNVGLMPITGIPLPFVSYGGSHIVADMAAVGVLLSIHRRRLAI